jgi:mono/diheme cytochrome c family protein
LWKRRYFDPAPHLALPPGAGPALVRGRYLAEGPGHCTECHTPRDKFGGLEVDRWLAGAAVLDGEGAVPNITPSADGLGGWSPADIRYFLESGFTPDFDTVGGIMVKVQENLARLDAADRAAIAAYLKAVPALPGSGSKDP